MDYLLKASAVVAIFYVSYKLFLQRDTFFEQNRWFLLLGLLTAFIVPFIVIPIYIEHTPAVTNYIIGDSPIITQNIEKPFNILDHLPMIYGLGVLFFSVRFIIHFISLMLVIIKNKGEKSGHHTFIKTTTNISPFSFFNWIVYNPNQFDKIELEQIIMHEKVHVRQCHSVDILITQLCSIALWFNPFIWLYNKDLKQNLEFIADQKALKQFNCKKSYQYTLLKTSMPSHHMALSNPFYNSLIKKRIVMLHKSKSKKINQFKYALVIPLLALFLMSFNTKEVYVEKEISQTDINQEYYEVIITKDYTDADFKRITHEANEKGITLKFSDIKRNSKNEIIKISAEFKTTTGSGNYNLDGKDPIKSFSFKQNDEGFGFRTEWETNFMLKKSMSNVKVVGYGTHSDTTRTAFKFDNDGKTPIFFIDEIEASLEDAEKLHPEDIKSMEIVKGDPAIEKYGDKAKDGVVEITTKKKK